MSMRYACELYRSIDDVNADYKLYFNITFCGLDQGLVPGVRIVHFDASADEFKQGAGCRGSWLSVYVKAVYPPGKLFLKWLFGLWFDTRDGTNAPPPSGTPRAQDSSGPLEPDRKPNGP